jgi:protocatechuate 4,5-dioxygenase, alpha chain
MAEDGISDRLLPLLVADDRIVPWNATWPADGGAMPLTKESKREEGPGELPGTLVFTGERSRLGYRLNKLAMSLVDPANRKSFLADETAYMSAAGLTPTEREMVRRRDWAAMIAHGGNIYLILKIAGTVGQTLLQMGAQMRGETLDALMATLPGHGKAGGR